MHPDSLSPPSVSPVSVTEVRRYQGQARFCGAGVAVVIDVTTNSAITLYADGVVTPLRPDQVGDPAVRSSRRLAAAGL